MASRPVTVTAAEVTDLGGELVVQAARLVRAARHRNDTVPPAGLRVLSLLDQHGPLGVGRLAELDRCSQPTMTGAVNGLVERGWATKEPDPGDARASRVTVTGSGAAALADVRRAIAADVSERFARQTTHSPEDLATAVSVLRTILETPIQEGPP